MCLLAFETERELIPVWNSRNIISEYFSDQNIQEKQKNWCFWILLFQIGSDFNCEEQNAIIQTVGVG